MRLLSFLALALLPLLAWAEPKSGAVQDANLILVEQLPAIAPSSGRYFTVRDSLDGGCTTGGGYIIVTCASDGIAWRPQQTSGSPINIDVNPNAPNTVTAGLREAFAACPIFGNPGQSGVTGGNCKLRLRCNTTYTIGARSTWANGNPKSHANYLLTASTGITQATSDAQNVLDFTLYHNVSVDGCGASSVIEYNGSTTNAVTYSFIFYSTNRNFLAPFNGLGSSGLQLLNFNVNWKEQCATGCWNPASGQSNIASFVAPSDLVIENVNWFASQVPHIAGQPDTAPGGIQLGVDTSQAPDSGPTNVRIASSHGTNGGSYALSLAGCKNCVITNNNFDKLGMPVNDPRGGPTDSNAIIIFGGQVTIDGNTFNIDYNGDTSATFRNYGVQLFQVSTTAASPYRGNLGSINITGNIFYGARREGDREIGLLGDSGVNVVGNSFYGGMCSGDNTWSCRNDLDCSEAVGGSKGTCIGGGGSGVMYNLAYNGCPITRLQNIQSNSFFNFAQYDGSGGGDNSSMNCPIKIQGPFNTDNTCPGYPSQDPNDNLDNIIANNLFVLTDPNKPGICSGSAAATSIWANSRNSIYNNVVVGYTGAQASTGGAGTYQGLAGFGGNTTAIPLWKVAYSKTFGSLLTDYDERAKPTNYTVTDDDCRGTTFSNAGAGGQVNFTLPVTRAGLHCKFYVRTAVATAVRLTPQSGTTIRPQSSTASQTITSDGVLGSYVELEGQDSTTWIILGQRGTWTAP